MTDIEKVKEYLKSDDIVVAQIAPAVRVSIGEEFGLEPGTEVTKKIVSALRKLGFKYVFDTCFGADIVALEEAHEFKERIEHGGPFPLITSCCIGWKLYALKFFPDKMHQLSTCMAPQIATGALAKTYFAEKSGTDPEKIKMVSIMPCISKKKEAELHAEIGVCEINKVLTTREIAQLLKEKNVDLMKMDDSDFDEFLGEASQGGRKFGVTGGVAEAVVNTMFRLYGDNETSIKIEDDEEVGYYSFNVGGQEINVVRVFGLHNFVKVLKKIEEDNKNPDKKTYHLIEVMACPYGCLGGPGQPLPISMDKNKMRAKSLREYANKQTYTDPLSNPEIKKVYDTYLSAPGCRKSKDLLHIGCMICKIELDKLSNKNCDKKGD